MDWVQVTVMTTSEGAELVSQLLIELGSGGTMIEDKKDVEEYGASRPEGRWDILDEKILQNMPEDVRVSGYYPADERVRDVLMGVNEQMGALKLRAVGVDLGKLEVVTQDVDDEDWAENWKRQYVPFRLGVNMVVKPGWCAYEAREGDRIIEIDPGMAFGTGTHETTALCVELIEEIVKKNDDVIDVGTGTGILAIAAALAGARSVLATDIDPIAVRIAGENAKINGLSDVIKTRQGDLLQGMDAVADVVIANIIADVIIMIAAPVRAHVVPGGVFICSGIAREKKQGVIDALNRAGYRSLDVREKGEWSAIAARN